MPKKSKIDQHDIDIFKNAMQGVRPLVYKKTLLKPKNIPTNPLVKQQPENEEKDILLIETTEPSVGSQEYIVYKHESVSNKILRKLKKGQYNVEAILDLHGMSVEKARIAVKRFLQQCLQKGIRVALIIHGKGRSNTEPPVLKNKLNLWLRNLPIVLAFCSAPPAHGGSGATIILMKNLSGRM